MVAVDARLSLRRWPLFLRIILLRVIPAVTSYYYICHSQIMTFFVLKSGEDEERIILMKSRALRSLDFIRIIISSSSLLLVGGPAVTTVIYLANLITAIRFPRSNSKTFCSLCLWYWFELMPKGHHGYLLGIYHVKTGSLGQKLSLHKRYRHLIFEPPHETPKQHPPPLLLFASASFVSGSSKTKLLDSN